MIRRKICVFIIFLGILIISIDAFALEVREPFWFFDFELPGKVKSPWETKSWTHEFYDHEKNELIYPSLSGLEPNLIIERAWLLLSLNFTPNTNGKFKASAMLEGNLLGNINYSSWFGYSVYNWIWTEKITSPVTLYNGEANIEINVSKGKLKYVQHSLFSGKGVVGPEPISMALVGAGLAGLPIAVRFRRLLRK